MVAGDAVKLRETPKASPTKARWKHHVGQVNGLGYGNNGEDVTMDNLQPSPKFLLGIRVQFND